MKKVAFLSDFFVYKLMIIKMSAVATKAIRKGLTPSRKVLPTLDIFFFIFVTP